MMRCPGCFKADRSTFWAPCRKRLFDGKKVPFVLPFSRPDYEKSKLKIPDLHESDIEALEQAMDAMDAHIPPLKVFVLPGGHQSVSFCHIARCVCRRTERLVIALQEESFVEGLVIKYLNRLSDYLFVLGRMMAHELGTGEIPWKPRL